MKTSLPPVEDVNDTPETRLAHNNKLCAKVAIIRSHFIIHVLYGWVETQTKQPYKVL